MEQVFDNKKCMMKIAGGSVMEREDTDECFQRCSVSTKDILDIVKSAVKAAEAIARAANAPMEAVKAAGDAAVELVKSTAMDVKPPQSFFQQEKKNLQ